MALNTEKKMDCHKCSASQADGPFCCTAQALDAPALKNSLEKKSSYFQFLFKPQVFPLHVSLDLLGDAGLPEIVKLRPVFVQSPRWHCNVTNLPDSGLGRGAKTRRNLHLPAPNMLRHWLL